MRTCSLWSVLGLENGNGNVVLFGDRECYCIFFIAILNVLSPYQPVGISGCGLMEPNGGCNL